MNRIFLSLLLLLLMTVCAFSADNPADVQTWSDFMTWYKAYTGPPYPQDLIKNYMASLKAAGKSDDEVKSILMTVQKMGVLRSPEMLQLHFNKVYTLHKHLFTAEPNKLMMKTIEGRKPGKALDIGMGQGRNSVFLAMQGWDVTGYDLSDEALAQSQANAKKAGVKLTTIKSTHETFDFGKDQWDLIIMMYSLMNMEDKALLAKIKGSLKPGGLIIVENPNSAGEGKGPANALFRTFEDLRVIHYEDLVAVADWSLKPNRLGRLVAEKD